MNILLFYTLILIEIFRDLYKLNITADKLFSKIKNNLFQYYIHSN